MTDLPTPEKLNLSDLWREGPALRYEKLSEVKNLPDYDAHMYGKTRKLLKSLKAKSWGLPLVEVEDGKFS